MLIPGPNIYTGPTLIYTNDDNDLQEHTKLNHNVHFNSKSPASLDGVLQKSSPTAPTSKSSQ